jgi:hypothetical protein
MDEPQQVMLPDGYLWLEDLSKIGGQKVSDLTWLCENKYMSAVRLNGRWAVEVVRTTTTTAGSVIVRDLNARRDIAIGAIVGQYITNIYGGRSPSQLQLDTERRIKSEPILDVINGTRRWIYITWAVLFGGLVFDLVGVVLSWPVAAFMIIPAISRANHAYSMAQKNGDRSLIEEVKRVRNLAQITTYILWGGIALAVLFYLASSGSRR